MAGTNEKIETLLLEELRERFNRGDGGGGGGGSKNPPTNTYRIGSVTERSEQYKCLIVDRVYIRFAVLDSGIMVCVKHPSRGGWEEVSLPSMVEILPETIYKYVKLVDATHTEMNRPSIATNTSVSGTNVLSSVLRCLAKVDSGISIFVTDLYVGRDTAKKTCKSNVVVRDLPNVLAQLYVTQTLCMEPAKISNEIINIETISHDFISLNELNDRLLLIPSP